MRFSHLQKMVTVLAWKRSSRVLQIYCLFIQFMEKKESLNPGRRSVWGPWVAQAPRPPSWSSRYSQEGCRAWRLDHDWTAWAAGMIWWSSSPSRLIMLMRPAPDFLSGFTPLAFDFPKPTCKAAGDSCRAGASDSRTDANHLPTAQSFHCSTNKWNIHWHSHTLTSKE